MKSLSCVRLFVTPRTDCSPPGSSVHGIFQARILEWVAISFSRRSSQPRDWTRVSRIVGRCLPSEPQGKSSGMTQSSSQDLPDFLQGLQDPATSVSSLGVTPASLTRQPSQLPSFRSPEMPDLSHLGALVHAALSSYPYFCPTCPSHLWVLLILPVSS